MIRCAVLAATLWCGAAHSVAPDEPHLALGPGLMTFDEIAAALSVGGHHVEAGADVLDCAAFVCIKDRPWSQARDLLCHGLDVILKEQKEAKDTWTLTRDPAMREREQLWRRRLAQNIRSFIRAQLPGVMKLMEQSSGQLKAQAEQMKQELDSLESQGQKNTAHYRSLYSAYLPVYRAASWGAQERLYMAWIADNFATLATMERAVDVGWASWIFPSNVLPASLVVPIAKRASQGEQSVRHDYAMGDVSVTPMPGSVAAHINLYLVSEESGFESIRGPGVGSLSIPASFVEDISKITDGPAWVDWIFRGGHTPDSGVYNGLGDEALAWLQQQREQTAAFLKTERANAAIPTQRWRDSLSQWVEAWCQRVGGEAVMELCPGGEANGDVDGIQLHQASYSLADLRIGPFSGSFGAWTLEDENGVLLVKNQLAFLYRARQRPVAALIRLLRKLGTSDSPKPALPALSAPSASAQQPTSLDGLPFPVIRDYVRAVTARPHAYWSYPQIFSDRYRGFSLGDLDHVVPLVYVWDHLASADRQRLVDEASSAQGRGVFPLAKLGLRDLSVVGRSLQAWGAWCWTYLARDPIDWARSETLYVGVATMPDQPNVVRLTLDFSPRPEGVGGHILWSPQ